MQPRYEIEPNDLPREIHCFSGDFRPNPHVLFGDDSIRRVARTPPMKIQVVSDLHLEFPGADLTIPNHNGDTDLLILSGDICTTRGKADRYAPFFARCADAFPAVVYVAGNHEFYDGDIDHVHDKLRELVSPYINVAYLNNETAEFPDIPPIFGAAFWTDCNQNDDFTKHVLWQSMNDYRLIYNTKAGRRFSPDDGYALHQESIAALTRFLTAHSGNTVIVAGHHAPSKQSTHPRYANDTQINGGYSSDLNPFIELNHEIALWTHGHTHTSWDYRIGRTRVVANPRGYWMGGRNENAAFDPEKVIEI